MAKRTSVDEQDITEIAKAATDAYVSTKKELKNASAQQFLNTYLDTYELALKLLKEREKKKKEELKKNPYGLVGEELKQYNETQEMLDNLFV